MPETFRIAEYPRPGHTLVQISDTHFTAGSASLHQQWRLADAVRGTDVRAIVSGHLHDTVSGMFAGIPVSTATSVAHSGDLSAPADAQRGADGGGEPS